MGKKKCLLLFICICLSGNLKAQVDSIEFYREIDNFTKRTAVTKFIGRLFFKPLQTPPKPSIRKKKKPAVKTNYFRKYQGKIIRDIYITTLKPFGYSITDTLSRPHSLVQRGANTLHTRTQRVVIKNLLLFKKNDAFDSLKVRESERLIRTQKFVRDVVITAVSIAPKSDSVDVFIRELDLFTITAALGASPKQLVLNLTDRNFLGLGHRFENKYNWNHTSGNKIYEASYLVPNINKTYISLYLDYVRKGKQSENYTLDLQRPFYSPLTKWAWGSYFMLQTYSGLILSDDSLSTLQKYKSLTQDYWGGRAWQLFKGSTEQRRTTNLILSGRYSRLHYYDKPPSNIDTTNSYSNSNLYLAGIGISTRKYIQDKFVFNYGVTEDVPVGKAYGIVTGFRAKNNSLQWYSGFRISWGSYYSFGYFSTDFEFGTFINKSKPEQGTLFAELNYFTGLLEVGGWKFRQFIKPQLTLGFNRLPTERLTLSSDLGIRGFTSNSTIGNHRLLIVLQTQSYAPWNILGFRFGPYFIYALGMLGDEHKGFRNSKVYSQIGLGVLLKNDYLVLNTLQFSIAFYPLIPGAGSNIFKVNRYKTYNYGYRDFGFEKPSTIVYD